MESSAFIGFLFPGEIAVILGGVAAAAGRMPLPVMIAAAILGAVIGDSIGYAVGKRWGERMLHGTIGRLPIVRHELERHLTSAKAFVRKRGPQAVFIGRFTAALRVLVPGLSGMAELPYPTFLLYNVLGAVLWGTDVRGARVRGEERVGARGGRRAAMPGSRCSRSSSSA